MIKVIMLSLGIVLLTPIGSSKEKIKYEEPKILTVKLSSKDIPIKKEEIEDKRRIYINVELTYYCNDYACTQNTKNVGKTASGRQASRGTIAVPREIPLGSIFYIDGVQHRADDRGSAIKINNNGVYIIDVWVATHKEALKNGRKKARMYREGDKYYIETL